MKLSKIASVLFLALLAALALYQSRQAAFWRAQVEQIREQQAALKQQTEGLVTSNSRLSNQIEELNRAPALNADRLRELLRLRSEVGMLRRQNREMEQKVASTAAIPREQVTARVPSAEESAPLLAPFQVQLVSSEASDSTESLTNNANSEVLHLEKAPLMDYTAVRSVTSSRDPINGATSIDVEFNPEGNDLFAAVTKEQLNKRLAIVLNGKIYAAPVIRSEIRDGKAQISGNFTEEEAQQLAAKINEAIHPQ